jgi:membrane-associated protease RseP (regulator of RpoE activity)
VEPAREDYPGLITPEVDVRRPPRPKFQDRSWLHVLLFMATFVVTTFMGADHYAGFLQDFNVTAALPLTLPALVLRGLWYSVTILLILGCHEMGHYLACRYYDVDASLPFFIPAPFVMTGTLGAFIRIREPIQHKHVLFDIGIAGPIAGFLVAVPALFIGVAMSHVTRIPPNTPGLWEIGEPLLFKAAEWVFWGSAPDGYSLNMHPVAFAAWFGLLATALNLFPIGQLDGGHISYAVFGRRSTYITFAAIGVAAILVYVATSWLLWTALMITMLVLFGPRHPPVADEHVPLDRTRLLLAVFALLMFVLCFTPAPIRPSDIIGR